MGPGVRQDPLNSVGSDSVTRKRKQLELERSTEEILKKLITEQLTHGHELGYCFSGHSDGLNQPAVQGTQITSPSSSNSASPDIQATHTSGPRTLADIDLNNVDLAADASAVVNANPSLVVPADTKPHVKESQLAVLHPETPAPATVPVQTAPANQPSLAALETQKTPDLPPLSPLPPPSPSDSPGVHTEYQLYLARFEAGDTLAQRWHRLKHSGKWEDLKEDWEEWQSDLLLQQLQASNAASRGGRGRTRGRKELEDLTPAEADEGARKSRSRRAPATLQDYQVDTPVSASPGPGAAYDDLAPHRQNAGAHNEEIGSEGEHEVQARMRSRRELPPRIVQHRVYQPQQPQHNEQVLHQQPQKQGWPGHQQQHQQPSRQLAAGADGFAPELMQQLYQLGAQLGAALQQQGSAAAAPAGRPVVAGVSNPAALAAVMEALRMRMFNGDTAAMMQHLAAAFQQQH